MKQLFITSIRDWENDKMGTVEMREVPVPEPGEEEIRVRIAYSAFCGSDAHTLAGNLGSFEEGTKAMLPMTFGHECSGIIDKAGAKAEAYGYKEGDRVIINYAKYCHACDMCRSGHENLCTNVQFCMNGFAEYAVYHVTQVHKLPEGYDLRDSALTEPLTIAMSAVEQAKVSFGKSVAIMGAGGLGLMMVQLCRMAGASEISVFDIVDEKLKTALETGADHVYNTKDQDVYEKAIQANGGRFDCVLEGTGNTAAAKLALRLLTRNGDGVYFAMYGKDPILPVDMHQDLYWDQKHIHGLIMGASMFPKAMRTVKRMDFKPIIQKVYPLSQYQEAVDALLSNKYAKVMLKMNEEL